MSEFHESEQETPQINSTGRTFVYQDDMLEEVDVGDDAPPESDDEGSVWSDMNEEGAETFEDVEDDQPVIDLAKATFSGHTDSVYCVAVHPLNPSIIITGGGDDKAYLWKIRPSEDPENPHFDIDSPIELSGHSDSVTSVGFNFDSTLALTAGYDGCVRIWNVESGTLKHQLEGPEDIEWAEWHSKGNAVLAGSKDGTIWMWLAHNGQCLQVFAGHDGAVMSGGFTRDGKAVISGGEDGTVRIWGPKTGVCKYVFQGPNGHQGVVTCLSSSEDGEQLITGSTDGTVKLLQVTGHRVLKTFIHASPQAASVSSGAIPEGEDEDEEMQEVMGVECVGFAGAGLRWVASGGMDGYLRVWDVVSGACRSACHHEGGVVSLQWHPSLPFIVTGALDGLVRCWDARDGSLLHTLTGHRDQIVSLLLCPQPRLTPESEPSGEMIVTASDDHTCKVFYINAQLLMQH